MRKRVFYSLIFTFLLLGSFESYSQNENSNNASINSMLLKKKQYNKKYGFGFSIQLYNGIERRAKSLRSRFRVEFPNITTKLKYDAPEWKIQVGNYKTQLEADKSLLKISEKFEGAIVVPVDK